VEPQSEALRLLRRQSELEEGMRRPGDIRVTEEPELYALRAGLKRFLGAVRGIRESSSLLHRPVDTLPSRDVEGQCDGGQSMRLDASI
jgi:hypothetical protein